MSRRPHRGFTLVEMLVVITIIGILAALLLPAINRAIVTARNTAIAVEVNQLASAIESYKQDKGDYPPNFRESAVVARHIRKCYPKIDPTYFGTFMTKVFPTDGLTDKTQATTSLLPVIDESEALVFWLSLTDTDPQFPFLSAVPQTGRTPSPKKYYDFDQTRLTKTLGDVPSYNAKYCKESFYLYIDSRSYDHPATDAADVCRFKAVDGGPKVDTFAFADDAVKGARPYWMDPIAANSNGSTVASPPLPNRDLFKPMNPTSFQIICAGQDGEFGDPTLDTGVKAYPSGVNYQDEDNDNITNFSNGKTLKDNIPN